MTIRLGLTGSIGMGKSTTARLFAEAGCDVWDADAAVHRLYANGGAAVAPIGAVFPSAIKDGAISRDVLKQIIAEDATALPRLESIVHPLVADDRTAFLANSNADIVVLDIPLLFETGGDAHVDATVVVMVDDETQYRRVMDRGTMTDAQFQQIKSKQMPSAEKAARADFVIVTDTLEHARQQVHSVIEQIKNRQSHA